MYAYLYICILHSPKNDRKPKPSHQTPSLHPVQLLSLFVRLLPQRALTRLPVLQTQSFYDRLFGPLVTLWYLLFQRLAADHTLQAVVADARAGGADRLNKKLSSKLRSDSTASYSDARQRLPWQFLAQALLLQARNLLNWSPATTRWNGWVVALLDGSTVRLRPYGSLGRDFAANRNAHGRPYWCLMRVTVGFCALSGAALDCVMGSIRLSEQAMACEIILRTTAQCLFLGDSNFGVFRVVQAARHSGQQVLLRLTQRRARRLLDRKLVHGNHPVLWAPSRKDQLQSLCSTQALPGRLLVLKLQRRGFRSQWLYLFTTLSDTAQYAAEELLRLYGLRWHVELNLRYLKTQMDLVQLEAKSPDMARKEWLAGLLAYNLIRAAQLCAALHKAIPPLTLSFSGVRRVLECFLRQFGRTRAQTVANWTKALQQMTGCRLPRRRKPRPQEPRAQRHLREPYPPLRGTRQQARKHIKKCASKS